MKYGMTNIKFNQYNQQLTAFAKENRNNPTIPELKVWREILSNKKTGYKFTRQKPIKNFILDFYSSELLLGIEIDGDSHFEPNNKRYDKKRTLLVGKYHIKIIRYTNKDVMENIEGVHEDVMREIEKRKAELDI
jgi:very-short-patch-repair endonuclease